MDGTARLAVPGPSYQHQPSANRLRIRDAIAIYELNSEFYPESVSIAAKLAGLYERQGEVEAAIGYYVRVLELRPGHRGAQARLEALRSQQ